MERNLDALSKAALSRRSLLRFGTLLPAAGGLTMLLAGCSDDNATPSSDGGKTNGTYMTASGMTLSFVETMVAKERGFFDQVGLNLTIKGGQGTSTALQAVLGGSAHVTRANAINAIIAVANEQAPLVTIATVRQKSQFEIVSMPDKAIRAPGDLKGKTCGIVSAGGATENLLDIMLISAGIDPKSVKRPVTGTGTAAYEMARNGAVDAWVCVDTDRATIEREIGKVYYFSVDEFATMPSDSYNTTQQMIESGSDMPARFLAGVLKAMEYASKEENWPQVVEDLRKYNPEVNADQAIKEMPLLVQTWQASGSDKLLELDREVWTKGQEGLVKAGLVKTPAPLDKLIYPAYLEKARTL